MMGEGGLQEMFHNSKSKNNKDKRLKLRRCKCCQKEIISKKNKCIGCRIDGWRRNLGKLDKFIDLIIKYVPDRCNTKL